MTEKQEILLYKNYKVELVNGTKAEINIPKNDDVQFILRRNDFINDPFTNIFVRSNSIIKFEYQRDIEATLVK